MRGIISKSWCKKLAGPEGQRDRKGGQGVRREAESERFEEKDRAVIKGETRKKRSAKMGAGRVRIMGTKAKLIQPIATRCVRAARSGRIEHDPRRTRRVVAQTARHKRSDKSKAKRRVKHGEWSDCRIVPEEGR